MAGNQIVLSFTGDTKPLEDSFGRVGNSSKEMSKKVGSASRDLDEHANGLSKVGEAADNSERNIIGLHDVIDGTATIMQGPGKQGIVAYIQGWADLAGGLAPLILTLAETKFATIAQTVASKAAAAGTKVWAAAQWLMNTALLASPITWIVVGIVALVAVIVLIATKTDWFQRAWRASWGWIRKAASNAWDFIKKIPGWIGSAFSRVAGLISAPFRSAFNFIASAWNNTIGRLAWTVPGWVPGIGGYSISVPQLPHFHSGGVVGGTPGSEQLAVLQAGERVQTRGAGQAMTLEIRSGGAPLDDLLVEILSRAVRVRGGNVQLALGGRNG
jgi:phage-related protein